MILQLNPTIDVKTPLGDCEAMFLIDYGVNTNTVWVCRMAGGDVKHFYSDDIKVYDNPMNGSGWDIGKEITVNPEYAHHLAPKTMGEFMDATEDMFKYMNPSGKWSAPPDHPDNGGALIGQDKEKWTRIEEVWFSIDSEPTFHGYLDSHYQPPVRFNLDSWTKVQNWYRSLVDYKDVSFLDFLVKFYPAPELKK